MEISKMWSTGTLILYLVLAFMIALLFKVANSNKENKKVYFFINSIIFFVLLIFSAFRYISIGIGGADSLNYIKSFENAKYIELNLSKTLKLDDLEWVFFNLLYAIRLFTSNYQVAFIVIYSIITFGYMYFVNKNIDSKNAWIVAALLILPILKGFNIIRNVLSAAIILIALEKLKNKKYFGYYFLVTIAFLIHYSAIVMYAFGIYYAIVFNKQIVSKKIYIRTTLIFMALISIIIPVFETLVLNSGYNGYLDDAISLIGYIPNVILFIIISLNFNDMIKRLKDNSKIINLGVFEFNLFILPLTIFVGGANRFDLFFEMCRFVLWGELIELLCEKASRKGIITGYNNLILIKVLSVVLVIAWITFRIYRIWNGYALMPYYNLLFM